MTFLKDPDAILDYKFDWTLWLGDDTIDQYIVEVSAGDVEIASSEVTDSSKAVTVWLSGGTVGTNCAVLNHIITTGGRQDDRSMVIVIQEK